MARVYSLKSKAEKKMNSLIALDKEYQFKNFSNKDALNYCVEYVFLEGFKTWENFVENVFISHARYNDPVFGKRSFPYLTLRTETHALELLTLEKDFIDWTSPDNIITRADRCFRNSTVLTDPIKLSMQDLRDMKKIRNHIAHGSRESQRLFENLVRQKIGKIVSRSGDFLNANSPDGNNSYNVYYLEVIKKVLSRMVG